jgi:hypothetical protein
MSDLMRVYQATNNPSSDLLKRLNNTILDINDYRDEYCRHVNKFLIQIYKDNLLPESNIIGPYGNVIIERLELPHIKELPLMEAIQPIITPFYISNADFINSFS